MADIQFADFGNALLAGSNAAYQQGRGRREAETEKRRQEAQPFYEAAAKGDPAAMAKVASDDPHGATAMATMLGRIDATQAAKVKAAADYAARGANAVLQADPAERPGIYSAVIAEGRRNGYQINLPDAYSPALDGQLRAHRAQAQDINKWFEEDAKTKREQGNMPVPLGGSPAPAGGSPGGTPNYGGAIAGIESAGQPNGGYGAIGPDANGKGNRAYGKYQVMDFNVGPWTQEILGKAMTPQEFAANPQAQDAVFNGKFGQYVQKYGSPQAAARAWFAGEGGMNNPGAKDVNGTTVAGYESRFNNALGGGQAAPGKPGPVAMPEPPAGLTPSTPPAQMPGAPSGLVPPGPPPAQMPQPQLAQGDTGNSLSTAPEAQLSPEARSIREIVRATRPGWQVMVMPKTRLPIYDHAGRLYVRGPNGEEDYMDVPKPGEQKGAPPKGSFAGNAIEAQYANVLENGDPASFAYAQAYAHFSAPRTTVNENGQMVTIQPNVGHIRPPTFRPGGQAAPATAAAPSPGALPPATPPIQAPGGQNVSVQTIPEIQANKPMNNEQARDAGFSDRMTNSNGIVAAVENQGKSGSGRFKEAIPFGMGNFAQSEDYQKFKQARDDFINAQLRRESGAAINADEYTKADKQYFPVPGDSQAVIEQKALNRKIAVESMVKGAGPAYKPRAGAAPNGGDREKLLNDARAAIQSGANPAAVAKRLKDMGVEGGL